MAKLQKGQAVTFYRFHDKSNAMRGHVQKVNADSTVEIKTVADKGSISRIETAHADDVTPVEDDDEEEAEEPLEEVEQEPAKEEESGGEEEGAEEETAEQEPGAGQN